MDELTEYRGDARKRFYRPVAWLVGVVAVVAALVWVDSLKLTIAVLVFSPALLLLRVLFPDGGRRWETKLQLAQAAAPHGSAAENEEDERAVVLREAYLGLESAHMIAQAGVLAPAALFTFVGGLLGLAHLFGLRGGSALNAQDVIFASVGVTAIALYALLIGAMQRRAYHTRAAQLALGCASITALPVFPVGTACGAALLAMLLSPKHRALFRAEHTAARLATPEIQPRTWVFRCAMAMSILSVANIFGIFALLEFYF